MSVVVTKVGRIDTSSDRLISVDCEGVESATSSLVVPPEAISSELNVLSVDGEGLDEEASRVDSESVSRSRDELMVSEVMSVVNESTSSEVLVMKLPDSLSVVGIEMGSDEPVSTSSLVVAGTVSMGSLVMID